jgi:1-acyl-sn-glycerol-3-phosphate acyltransferase
MMCDPPSSAKADHGAAKENAIVIVNHQSMVDMVVYFMFALRFGRIGDTKSFSKESLKYWPGIGWALMMLDVIFVKRNWQSDAKHVIQQFEKIKNRRQPFWVVIFPEGTRITPGKLVVSQEISRQKNLPVLQHVLLPRPKGFITAVTMLKEKIDAVYDVTIHYEEKIPSLLNLMCGQVHNIRIHAKRCAFADLPTCEEELKDWLVQRFVEKDVAMGRLNTP